MQNIKKIQKRNGTGHVSRGLFQFLLIFPKNLTVGKHVKIDPEDMYPLVVVKDDNMGRFLG